MKSLLLAIVLLMTAPGDVVCRIGTTWTGSLSDLAAIEAVHQQQAAQRAGVVHPSGAPEPSPWVGLVRCARV